MRLTPEEAVDYFRLASLRLYQPDEDLKERLIDGTGRLAAYAKTLSWVGSQYFGGLARDFGSMGVFIGVGVLPGERTRLWCETVDVVYLVEREAVAVTGSLETAALASFGAHADAALAVLMSFGATLEDREVDRVRRDILILAEGDLNRLRYYTDRARLDHRDVLMWAEYPPDDDEPRTYSELRTRLGLPPDPHHK